MADRIYGVLASMAQQFSGLPMDSLIGGPLQAAASAQQGLAIPQTRYILNTGFNQTKDAHGQITYRRCRSRSRWTDAAFHQSR